MSLSLLQALEGEEYDTAFFLTYTLNLRFFEGLVLPRLLRMGVRHIGILVDHTCYAETLRDGRRQEQSECGRSYIVAPVRLRGGGIQHAKAVWLSGADHRVFVGSHNLTMSGFNDQIELTTELRSTNPTHVAALHELAAAISEVVPRPLWSTWTRIRDALPNVIVRNTDVHVLTNLQESLEDQLVHVVGPAEYLRVVTPFLDGGQLRRLVERIGAQDVVLDVPCEGLDIPLTEALLAVPTLTIRSVDDDVGRRLHAKGYEFRAGDVTWTAIGSANCTNRALAHSVAEGSHVTQASNLEFLVVTKAVSLPTDLKFRAVGDPSAFRTSGRTWNEGRASSALMVTRAECRHQELRVEWEVTVQREVSLAELQVGDHLAYRQDANAAVLYLENPPPDYVTLRCLVGEDVVEAHAWITNLDDLERAAQRAHIQRWAEQIGSRDPLQLASSLELWLTIYLARELRRDQPAEAAAEESESGGATQSVEHAQRMRDFHEVFTYSTDETKVRHAAEQMLAGPKGADPLAIFRALFARISNTTADDELPSSSAAASADNLVVQRNYAAAVRDKEVGQQRVVDAFIRHLKILARDSAAWATPHTPGVEEKIRLAACLIVLIGYEWVRGHPKLGRRAPFAEAGLKWAQAIIEGDPNVIAGLIVRVPLAMSLAVLGDIALLAGQPREHDTAASLARSILGSDPRAMLEAWRRQCSDQADTLLTAVSGRDLHEPLTRLAEELLGIPHPHVRAQLHNRWALLLALQDADTRGVPEAEILYAQAAEQYKGSEVWQRYRARRTKRAFPIIVQARNGRCPRCGLQLSLAENHKLNHGEPVLTACQHILLVAV
jgi:hypothetical protein